MNLLSNGVKGTAALSEARGGRAEESRGAAPAEGRNGTAALGRGGGEAIMLAWTETPPQKHRP